MRRDEAEAYAGALRTWVAERHPAVDRRLVDACADPVWRAACERARTPEAAAALFDTLFVAEVERRRRRPRSGLLLRRAAFAAAVLLVAGGLFALFTLADGREELELASTAAAGAHGLSGVISVADQMRYHGRANALARIGRAYGRSRRRALRLYRAARRPPLSAALIADYHRALTTARRDRRRYLRVRRELQLVVRDLLASRARAG